MDVVVIGDPSGDLPERRLGIRQRVHANIVALEGFDEGFRHAVRFRTADRGEARAGANSPRPIRSESRARLVHAIAKGRLWLDELVSGRATSTRDIADHEKISDRSVRMTLGLAFISPRLVQAAVDGALPFGSGLSRLTDLPPCWNEQLTAVGYKTGVP